MIASGTAVERNFIIARRGLNLNCSFKTVSYNATLIVAPLPTVQIFVFPSF